MNIRSITGIFTPAVYKLKEKVTGQTDKDRDAQGETRDEQSKKRRNLTAQELEDAVRLLMENPGVKSNNLNVRLDTSGVAPVILIEDFSGRVVRRIPESDISLLGAGQQDVKGTILNRSL